MNQVIEEAISDAFTEWYGSDEFATIWENDECIVVLPNGTRFYARELGGGINGWHFRPERF